jgi:hypothetical protein
MNNSYKLMILMGSAIFCSTIQAFLNPFSQTVIRRSAHTIRSTQTRNISFLTHKHVATLLKKSNTFGTLKTLRENPADQRMVASIFLQRFALNTGAAFTVVHTLNTGFLTTTALYGTALTNAIRGSLQEYRQFLQLNAIRRDLQNLTIIAENNFAKIDLNFVEIKDGLVTNYSAIKTAEDKLSNQIIEVHAELGKTTNSTKKIIYQVEGNLSKQIRGTESTLSTQITQTQETLANRLQNGKEALEIQFKEIAKKINLTQKQLQSLLSGQQTLSDNQKIILDTMIKSLNQ